MAIDPLSAGLEAGTQLLGSYLNRMAAKKEKQREREFDIGDKLGTQQVAAEGALGQNQMSAFQALMNNYSNTLGRTDNPFGRQ